MSYRLRIAELQSIHSLVKSRGPVRFDCLDTKAETRATLFETDPPTAIAQRGGESDLLFGAPSGSGTEYRGKVVTLVEHHGVTRIGWDGRPKRCGELHSE